MNVADSFGFPSVCWLIVIGSKEDLARLYSQAISVNIGIVFLGRDN
jgi:hypothetical protein